MKQPREKKVERDFRGRGVMAILDSLSQKEPEEKKRGKSISPSIKYLRKECREQIEYLDRALKNGMEPFHHALQMDMIRFIQARLDVAVLIEKDFLFSQRTQTIEEINRMNKYLNVHQDVVGGKFVFKNSRLPIDCVLELLHKGYSFEEIVKDHYPQLKEYLRLK